MNLIDSKYFLANAAAFRYVKLSAGSLSFYSEALPLPHGDTAFAELFDALQAAKDEIFLVTWYLEPDMELKRHGWDGSVASRKKYRLEDVLVAKARAGVTVRILVWDFLNLRHGVLDRVVGVSIPGKLVMRNVQALRRKLRIISRKNDVAIAEFPMPFATHSVFGLSCELGGSHHQKFWIMRSGNKYTAFVGGMNLRQHDWDTKAHEVLNPRRNPSDMEGDERKKRYDSKQDPQYPPRHDWMVKLQGQAAFGVLEEFNLRWGMARKGKLKLPPLSSVAPAGHGFAQISHTIPISYGGGERAVLAVYEHAIAQATRFVYIENQYWTSEALTKALSERLQKVKGLQVVIVLPDKAEDPVIGDFIAGEQWYQLSRLWNAASRFRVRVYTLYRKHPVRKEYVNIYIHSKVAIIDDLWATIGSANSNNRSMLLDSECNVQLAHGPTVKKMRQAAWQEMLGGNIGEHNDPLMAIKQGWHPIGEANARAMTKQKPLTGMIAPLEKPKSPKRLPSSLRGFI
jgi:phosphatidylserine/phosphatidylglycerophosphate/cardiolipin synthase-like enzyme